VVDREVLREVSDATFDREVLAAGRPVLVEFFATWCANCRRLAPVIDRLAADLSDRVEFVKINVDDNPELVGRYGISSTPTLIVFDRGERVASTVGAHQEPAVRALLAGVLDDQRGEGVHAGQPGWVDAEACTLPTAERPLRQAEFDDLFATAVTSIDRVDRTRLRLGLTPDPAVAARAADLVVRETDCCGFFTFTLAATDGHVMLDVAVPDSRVDVLDALGAHAKARVRS